MSSTVRAPRRADSRQAKPAFSLAPMSRRAAGALIDMVLLLAVAGIASSALEGLSSGITRVRIDAVSGERVIDASLTPPLWLPLAMFIVLTAVYTITLMAIWGRTLGGWAMGIRCVRADTGAAPGWSPAARRWFVLYGAAGLLAFLPVVGPFAWLVTLAVGLSPLWDSNRLLRGYADYLGGDVVVMARGGVSQHR